MSKNFQKQWEKRATGGPPPASGGARGGTPAAPELIQADRLRQAGRLDEAATLCRQRIAAAPNDAQAHEMLGVMLGMMGQPDEAERALTRAVDLNPKALRASLALAGARAIRGDGDGASQALANARSRHPADPDALREIGDTYLKLGQVQTALETFQSAAKLRRNDAQLEFKVARAHQLLHQTDHALQGYRRVLQIRHDVAPAHANIAAIQAEAGEVDEAREQFRLAIQHGKDQSAGWQYRRATTIPVIAESNEQIDAARDRVIREVEDLRTRRVRLKDPHQEIAAGSFYFAYQGRNDRELQRIMARAYLDAAPDLAWSPPGGPGGSKAGGKLQIGICSAFLHEHTIGRVTEGLIDQIDRKKFEVVLLRTALPQDHLANKLDRAADRTLVLGGTLDIARKMIAQEGLDVLFYPDIGMESFTYFLAFSRLAPVQCVGWGHPDTTGVPNLDYYLSTEVFEPEEADEHYTETLIRLPRLYNYMFRPTTAMANLSKADLGLDPAANVYLCTQSLFKFHPDFDEGLKAILERDPRAVIAAFETSEPNWVHLLRKRFARTVGDDAQRIKFLSRQPLERFLGAMNAADAVIDTRHFTGGHTAYLAFHSGVPIVTWQGEFMRGRLTLGLYRLMGIDGLVAKDASEFASLAVRLGTDADYRRQQREVVRRHAPALFEDSLAVRQLEKFWLDAVEAARTGRKLSGWADADTPVDSNASKGGVLKWFKKS